MTAAADTNTGLRPLPRPRPATEEKYRRAVELYRTTALPCVAISRVCRVSAPGFQRYLSQYHRHLVLARYDIQCTRDEASRIRFGQLRGQTPATRAKYKKAVEACESLDHIASNVSQIARDFGIDGAGLGRHLRTHYPGIIEWRERERRRLGVGDNLPRGTRAACRERYAGAVELLRGNRYVTVREAAERCGVSYGGLKQHLLFYHKGLVERRIDIRGAAVRRQRKGEITGRGTVHAPAPATVGKYAGAVELFRTTPMTVAGIARKAGVSAKGLYEHLYRWHADLVGRRRNVAGGDGLPGGNGEKRKCRPATRAKYAKAVERLREGGITVTRVAAEYGLHPETFRGYLKDHEPALYSRQGMTRAANGNTVSLLSMEKYAEAVRLYATTAESMRSLAMRFGFDYCAFAQFVKRNYPELHARHRDIVGRRAGKAARPRKPLPPGRDTGGYAAAAMPRGRQAAGVARDREC